MKKIFVAGKTGQVALSLEEVASSFGVMLTCAGRPEFDLADNESIFRNIGTFDFDAIINAAAYTAVDAAEEDEDTAFTINASGPAYLAEIAYKQNIPFLHLSTDYVFDGDKEGVYVETDPTNPQGAYGRTKLAGEQAILAANPDAMIFRTAWVYSPFGKNFLKTMLNLAKARDSLSIVADQVGNPTYAPDIARALMLVLMHIADMGRYDHLAGIYHMTGSGDASWCDFANAIFAAGNAFGHPVPNVSAITTAEFPTPAKRPANSRLAGAKLEDVFGIQLPDWRLSTKACVKRLFEEGELS